MELIRHARTVLDADLLHRAVPSPAHVAYYWPEFDLLLLDRQAIHAQYAFRQSLRLGLASMPTTSF
jgi:hypothetical protein